MTLTVLNNACSTCASSCPAGHKAPAETTPSAPSPSPHADSDLDHHPETTTPPGPVTPPDLTPEEDFHLLRTYLNPDLDNFQVCELCGITPSQLIAWVNSKQTQQRLNEQTQLSETRATHCARIARPKAIATLQHIIESYNEAERNQLDGTETPAHLPLRAMRQRLRESARRAAGLIIRISGGIPAHLREACKTREPSPDRPSQAASTNGSALQDQSDLSSANQPGQPPDDLGALYTQAFRFLERYRAALNRRAVLNDEVSSPRQLASSGTLPADTRHTRQHTAADQPQPPDPPPDEATPCTQSPGDADPPPDRAPASPSATPPPHIESPPAGRHQPAQTPGVAPRNSLRTRSPP